MSKPFSDQAAVAGIELDEEIICFANLVRSAALEEAAKLVMGLYKTPAKVRVPMRFFNQTMED